MALLAKHRSCLWIVFLMCLVWCSSNQHVSAQAEAEKRSFDVSEGYAINTLKEAARQAEVEFIFSADLIKGVTTSSIQGNYTPIEAFSLMLEETSLDVFQHDQTGVYTIAKVSDVQTHKSETKSIEEADMNNSKNWFNKLISGVGTVILANSSTSAQDDSLGEQVHELSPFTISESEDIGYQATNTLAGTRIKTPLKDVGASITVITKEFLEDTGSTDAEDLLVYVGNVEVNGLGGNFSSAEIGRGVNSEGAHRRTNKSTRIRGLNNADTTRDYFLTDIPFDSYNTSRVMVNRGPNAILFGLGSPAGIINNGLIKATFEDSYNMEMRYGSYDSHRFSFDANRLLIDDRLAIRIAGLYDEQKFRQSFTYDKDRRIFGTFSFFPFKKQSENNKTLITGHAELIEIDANRPRISPPGDTITRWWTTANQQTIDHTTDWRDTNRNLFGLPGNVIAYMSPIFPDENSDVLGSPEGFVPITQSRHVDANIHFPFRGIAEFNDWAGGRAGWPAQVEHGEFYRANKVLDQTIFDYKNILLDGPNKNEWADSEAYNISLQQELFDGYGGFEISFDKQRWSEGFYSMIGDINGYSLQIDPNLTYPDGSPNPNFGRPFVASRSNAGESEVNRESFRATAFAELNFREKGSGGIYDLLGRHVFTGLFNSQKIRSSNAGFMGASTDQAFTSLYGFSNFSGNFGRVASFHYLGPSLANASSAVGANVPGINAIHEFPGVVNGLFWNPVIQDWETSDVRIFNYKDNRLNLASSASKNGTEVDSLAFIWQGYWLNDLLVTTVGWREDEAKSFIAPLVARDPIDNHVLLNDPNFVLGDDPIGMVKDDSLTYSYVLHAPDGFNQMLPWNSALSLHYNSSENFEPAAARFNVIGQPLSPPTGETEDYGITLEMFDGKFVARINSYEMQQANVGASVPVGSLLSLERVLHGANLSGTNDGNPELANYRLPPEEILDFWGWEESVDPNGTVSVTTSPRGSITAVTARQTEGLEMELIFNPTPNWRIMANIAQQEAVQDGLDAGVVAYLMERQLIWDTTGTLFGDINQNLLASEKRQNEFLLAWNNFRLNNGAKVQELREWRWNLITNYEFQGDTWLTGFGIGGALRWQDKAAIGAPVVFSDLIDGYALDVNNPIFGDSELNGDLWASYKTRLNDKVNWILRLNVRNVIGEDEMIPILAQPDGTYASIRIPEGPVWELGSSFEF